MSTQAAFQPIAASEPVLKRFLVRAWRSSNATVGWLPVSVIGLPAALLGIKKWSDLQRRLASYGCGRQIEAGKRSWFAGVLYALCGIPLGALAVFMWLLAVPNTVRNVFFYGLSAGDGGYQSAWGGPTLAGAWAMHAVLALLLVPVYMALFAGLGWLQGALARRLLGRGGTSYVIGAAAAIALGGAVFFVAFLHQL